MLSILYHPTAVERNGHCADSGPCGTLRAGGRDGGGGRDEGGRPFGQKGKTVVTDPAIRPANDWGIGRASSRKTSRATYPAG